MAQAGKNSETLNENLIDRPKLVANHCQNLRPVRT